MNGDTVTPQELEIRGLRTQVKELKSELEGRMDDANEAIYQLQAECKRYKDLLEQTRRELTERK